MNSSKYQLLGLLFVALISLSSHGKGLCMPDTVYHILLKTDWQEALSKDSYTPESLDKEGFIHLSSDQQFSPTANKYYSKYADGELLVLKLKVSDLGKKLIFDYVESREDYFAHLYRPLKPSEVSELSELNKNEKGEFSLPEKWESL